MQSVLETVRREATQEWDQERPGSVSQLDKLGTGISGQVAETFRVSSSRALRDCASFTDPLLMGLCWVFIQLGVNTGGTLSLPWQEMPASLVKWLLHPSFSGTGEVGFPSSLRLHGGRVLRWGQTKAPYTWLRVSGKSVPGVGFGHLHGFHQRQNQCLGAELILERKIQVEEMKGPG